MKNEKTNWTSPTTNFLKACNNLRKALASGYNACLVKEYNEACMHPIHIPKEVDFRQYESSYGTISSKKEILESKNMSEFEKHLSLNYVKCFGLQEAVDHYYTTGVLTKDNIKGMGKAHLVKVTDLIELFNEIGDVERANMYYDQYIWSAVGSDEKRHMFNFFKTDYHNLWGIKKFKSKLWVVELHNKKAKLNIPITQNILIKILNVCLYPIKYIPRHSVLHMPEYTNHTFRIGDVVNGFAVQFQIPKKFAM